MSSRKLLALAGQVLAFVAFAAVLVAFSAWPAPATVGPQQSLIKLSFTHAGARMEECRRRDPAEIAKLAPNMRVEMDCTRERVPVVVELMIDGELAYRDSHAPTGLWGDGPSVVYEKFWVPAGSHELQVRIRDSRRDSGFDYSASTRVDLQPQQNFVIDFRPDEQGVRFH